MNKKLIHKTRNRKSIYDYDENFFEIPNILNCYWAGFIAADGCVSKNNNRITIELDGKDKNHLIQFKNDVKFSGEVRDIKSNPKSLKPPNLKNEELIKAFIIGYIDGDGSIVYPSKCKERKTIISIRGTEEVLKWIKNYFDKWATPMNSWANLSGVRWDGKTFIYRINRKRAEKVINILIDLDVPKLKRKWYDGRDD